MKEKSMRRYYDHVDEDDQTPINVPTPSDTNKRIRQQFLINSAAIKAWLRGKYKLPAEELSNCLPISVCQALGLTPKDYEEGLLVTMIRPGGSDYQTEIFHRLQLAQAKSDCAYNRKG